MRCRMFSWLRTDVGLLIALGLIVFGASLASSPFVDVRKMDLDAFIFLAFYVFYHGGIILLMFLLLRAVWRFLVQWVRRWGR
jgi:hypothetical protein